MPTSTSASCTRSTARRLPPTSTITPPFDARSFGITPASRAAAGRPPGSDAGSTCRTVDRPGRRPCGRRPARPRRRSARARRASARRSSASRGAGSAASIARVSGSSELRRAALTSQLAGCRAASTSSERADRGEQDRARRRRRGTSTAAARARQRDRERQPGHREPGDEHHGRQR